MSEPAQELKIIRLTGEIDEPDALHAVTYPYKLTAKLEPPELMQVLFIMRYGGTDELILRGKTREALDHFIAQNDLTRHPRLRSLTITDPAGITEEIHR